MSIAEKLIKIQSNLKAPKSQTNTFGKYQYRNCEDILEALKPLLAEQGLYIFIVDNVELIGDRYYVKATVTISDGESSIFSTAYAREEETKKGMDGSQITGASSSYARKYALNGLFAIDDTKDADTPNEPPKTPQTTIEPTTGKVDKLRQDIHTMACFICANDTVKIKELYQKACNVDEVIHVPTAQLEALHTSIKSIYDKKKGATNG